MKKLLALLLAAIFVVSLFAGCTSDPGNSTNTPDPSTEQNSDPATPDENNDPYKIGVFLRFNDEAGTRMKAVIEKYISDFNGKGGVNAQRLLCHAPQHTIVPDTPSRTHKVAHRSLLLSPRLVMGNPSRIQRQSL